MDWFAVSCLYGWGLSYVRMCCVKRLYVSDFSCTTTYTTQPNSNQSTRQAYKGTIDQMRAELAKVKK